MNISPAELTLILIKHEFLKLNLRKPQDESQENIIENYRHYPYGHHHHYRHHDYYYGGSTMSMQLLLILFSIIVLFTML